jgi:two-component system response regulator HydG
MQKKKGRILIVDDNKQILESLSILLKPEFEQVDVLSNPNLIPSAFQTSAPDIILLDMNFTTGRNTGNEGLFWLREIRKLDQNAIVILITAYGDIKLAVQSIHEGATDFISKPWDAEKLIITLTNALDLRKSKLKITQLTNKQEELSQEIDRHFQIYNSTSQAFKDVMNMVEKVAQTDANVLILGENGTGKELIAREIHRKSGRAEEVFVSVDVASLSESLFESEMFGHNKGSFTDAKEDRIGRFEAASGGSLFLDEIGNLSIPLQSKLLAAIQNMKITRVGSIKPIDVDIRLICATNKPLLSMVKDQTFREDLLYRINTIQIELPPLRKRTEDIPGLADFFLQQFACKYGKLALSLSSEAKEKMLHYAWPGNVRELKHTIEKAVILTETNEIKSEEIFLTASSSQDKADESLKLEDIEKSTISRVLTICQGNLSQAAKILDVSRTTLYAKMKKYNL